jgi:sugar phosphate permease
VRYRWAVLAAGTAAQASLSAVFIGLSVLAPSLREHYDLSLAEVGVVLASVWVGPTLTLLPWGLLADRVGERWTLGVGLGACGIALAAAAFATEFASLVVALLVAGAAGSAVNSASGRAVMTWFSPEERGLALGVRQTAIPIGAGVAALAVPAFDNLGGVEAAILFLAAFCLAGAVAGAAVVRDVGHPSVEPGPWTLRDRRLWRLCIASGFYVITQIPLLSFLVLFLHDERGLSPGAAGAVLAAVQVLAAGLRIGAGRWSDLVGSRIEPLRRIGLATAVSAALAAALLQAPLGVLIPAIGIATALSMAWNGLSFTAAAELAGPARAGAAIGLQQTTLSVFGVWVPVGFAALVDASSWTLAFAVFAAAPLVGWFLLGQLAAEDRGHSREREPSLAESGLPGRQSLQRQARK